jgi:hypothetical protein
VSRDPRLSLATCRRLLGASGTGLTDAEVIRLVDQMYDLARIVVVLHEQHRGLMGDADLHGLSIDERAEVEERAAVLEFDAGMNRSDATRAALIPYLPVRTRSPKSDRS